MSSLEAALYAYSLEESWDARLRKWKSGSSQQVLECRTQTRDTRDHLLYLIQDAEEEGNREEATTAGYAYLRGRDRLLALRIGQRERRGRPDGALILQRQLLASLVEVVEPYVAPAKRQAIERFLEGQSAPEPTEATPSSALEADAPPDAAPVDSEAVQALLQESARLKSRLDVMEEGRRRLETEFSSADPRAIVEIVRELRSRLTEAEARLAPLSVERDALTREFGSFTATQIVAQTRLLKDRNAELYDQLRQLQRRLEASESRPAPEPVAVEPEPVCPECESWQAEREGLERTLSALERSLGLPGK